MIREYATTLLVWLAMIIGEIHTLFENSKASVNWIITEKVVMPVQWNVKYAGEEVLMVLFILAFLMYRKNRVNDTTVKALVVFYIADFLFYFYNFKHADGGYGYIYVLLLVAWIRIYNRKAKNEIVLR
jgi:TctA family transporter